MRKLLCTEENTTPAMLDLEERGRTSANNRVQRWRCRRTSAQTKLIVAIMSDLASRTKTIGRGLRIVVDHATSTHAQHAIATPFHDVVQQRVPYSALLADRPADALRSVQTLRGCGWLL
ncbi:hypothetical protein MRB53_041576 [Persea americana]|nr:hypothetical protein MRB53_041576 [Persea americana]